MEKILIIQGKSQEGEGLREMLYSAGYQTYFTDSDSDGYKIAVRYLPDMIICDIENPKTELQIVKDLTKNPSIESIPIIVTSDSRNIDFQKEVIQCGADVFIPKPLDTATLTNIIKKKFIKLEAIKEKLIYKLTYPLNDEESSNKKKDHILVKVGNKLKLIEFSMIICIVALKEYSKIITNDNCKIVFRKSLRQWTDTLPPKNFLRIHRATIINIDYIEKIEKTGTRTYSIYLKNISIPFQLSQRYANTMRKAFSI